MNTGVEITHQNGHRERYYPLWVMPWSFVIGMVIGGAVDMWLHR